MKIEEEEVTVCMSYLMENWMLELKGKRGISVIVFQFVCSSISVDCKLLEARNWLF